MSNTTLISTFLSAEAQITCIKEFYPSKIVLVRENTTPSSKLLQNEENLRKSVGIMTSVQIVSFEPNVNIYEVANKISDIIEIESYRGQIVILNLSE